MKEYTSNKKIEKPYFDFSEMLGFPIMPLVVVAFVSYVVLSLFGLTAMLVVDAAVSFLANAFYHGLKNSSPNGSSYSGRKVMPNVLDILSLMPSFLVILGSILTVNVGVYILVLFQETGVFYGIYFSIWLFVVVGIPFIYFATIELRYSNQVYEQAKSFTPLHLCIVQDVDYLTYAETIAFVLTKKDFVAQVLLCEKRDADARSDKEADLRGVSGRNAHLYEPVFSSIVQIPKGANRLKLSWYSITEGVYYSDEIDFPFDQLIYVENKYPTDLPKTLRGEKTDRVTLRILPGGRVELFNKHKTLIESIALQSSIIEDAQKNEWLTSAAERYGVDRFEKMIDKAKYSTSMELRSKLRDFVCKWQITGTGLVGHNIEIKDVVENYTTSRPLPLETFEQRRLPIEFEIDYHKLSWLFIHIDAEKLYTLLQSQGEEGLFITFDFALDLEAETCVFIIKNGDRVLPFTAWEKVINSYRLKEAKDYLEANKDRDEKTAFLKRIYDWIVEKEYVQAKQHCTLALQKYPYFPMIYFYEARLLWYEEGFEASYAKESYFLGKTKTDPYALAQIYNHYGCLYDEEKRYGEALERFKKAYASYPQQLFYLANIAEIHYKLKDAKQALHFAQECIAKEFTSDMVAEIIKNEGVINN